MIPGETIRLLKQEIVACEKARDRLGAKIERMEKRTESLCDKRINLLDRIELAEAALEILQGCCGGKCAGACGPEENTEQVEDGPVEETTECPAGTCITAPGGWCTPTPTGSFRDPRRNVELEFVRNNPVRVTRGGYTYPKPSPENGCDDEEDTVAGEQFDAACLPKNRLPNPLHITAARTGKWWALSSSHYQIHTQVRDLDNAPGMVLDAAKMLGYDTANITVVLMIKGK